MKKIIVKNWKRIASVLMAVILVVGSVNLSDIVVNAIGTSGYSGNPYYNTQDRYVYAEGDIFGAATHVHLFGRNVTSTAHTHGNVFAMEAFLSEYGTRDENNVLNNPIPLYDEVSYIQRKLHSIDSSSRINTLVVGSSIYVEGRTDGRYLVNVDGGRRKLDQTDHVYKDDAAINFNNEFAYLEGLSKQWAANSSFTIDNDNLTGDKDGITWDFSGMNQRSIRLDNSVGRDTNAFLTIPWDVWNGNSLRIYNLDSNRANRGILVINIDMAGADPEGQTLKVSGSGAEIYYASGSRFGNREYRTDEFGACRIVYNIIDSSKPSGLYEGKFDFGDTPSYGSILAPKAHAVVGAVNGTVIADTIEHVGQESHRMDIWALDESGDVPDESTKVNIVLHKTYNGGILGVENSDIENTEFGLYRTASCSGTPIATAPAVRDAGATSYATVTFTRDFGDLSNGETEYYIREIRTGDKYTVDDTIYKCVINKNGTNITVSYEGTTNDYFECDNTPRTEGEPPVSRTYTGKIGLEKIFAGNSNPDKALLGGTIFTLYEGYDPVANSFDVSSARTAAVKMDGNRAVVEFELRNITVGEGEDGERHYYITETSTVAPYELSSNIYEFRVRLNEAKNGCVVEWRLIKDANGQHLDAEYTNMTAVYPKCTNTKGSELHGTADFTIGLTKTYAGLNLRNLGNATAIQPFLNGTTFELIEVDENGQPAAGATAITLNPRWDGNNAVVSRKITIAEGATKYYRLSETKASDGFEKSGDVYIWKIVCDVDGGVSAEYKIGDGSYTSYTAGGSYPAVENARSPFSGTISLIKTYEDLNLAGMNASARTTLLNETTFALYNSPSDGAAAIAITHPVWENNQAVVKFDLGSNITVGSTGIVYYIRETEASTGYVKSDVVYECKISNVNGSYKVEYRAGSSGDYTPAITCLNAKQTFEIDPVTVVISKTFDNPAGLTAAQMTGLIRDTKFTFYTDAATTRATNDFALQPNPVNNSGTVAYTYNYTRALKPGDSYTYYVKETATNTSIYNMDTTVYKIDITVGQPTPGVANPTITPSVTCTKVGGDSSPTGISFTNTRIPKAQASTEITFTKVFENNFSNVDDGKVNNVISATRFTLYDNPACGANDIVPVSTSSTSRNGENVTYTYSLNTSSLGVDQTYYYYLKETSTNQNYYQLNNKTYVVRISIAADGKATVDYAEYGSSDYTTDLKIENLQTPDESPTVLDSLEIQFTKEFEGFDTYIDGGDIVKATTFTLTPVNGSASIGFIRLSPKMTGTGATYCYQLDLSKLNAATYTGGTYTIKESRTDGRYTTSTEVLTFEITVDENGEASVTWVGGSTIHNELKPENPPSTTPSGGGNSNPPSGGGGNNPGPNPPSDEDNDSTT
ncbi:MAG: hypothetical protein K2K96_00385, partial [Lachnospiraceae bacterium]|nr:hypothetical protein [Lachnospiraceae bacterium]